MSFRLLILCTLCALCGSTKADSAKPNVLLILTDDQGYGDLGFHGNELIETPAMDRLARQSTRFNRFMVCPFCSMTRASLMTGRYNIRTGCAGVTRGLETVRPDEVLIPEVLKPAGYAAACIGKWHIGEYYPTHPRGQGFDEFFGMPQGHWDNYFDPIQEHNGKMVQTKGFITDVLTEQAMDFIRKHRDGPFFCYLSYNAPHTPMQIGDKYFDKYKAKGIENDWVAAIYGLVENIDDNLKRLLALLDQLKIANDTIVIFMTDNGSEGPEGMRYNAGMRGMKGSVHEGGVRVPFFVRWPGKIPADRELNQLAAHIDVLPTIAELCGVRSYRTKPLDGRSLAPLLLDTEKIPWPDRMIFARALWWKDMVGANGMPAVQSVGQVAYPGAVRTRRWRAVNDRHGWQLFDMLKDPAQKKNVGADHPQVVTRLASAYDDWFSDVRSTPIQRPTIEIGHREWPETKLTVPEARFTDGLRWYNTWGFAHDWITGWTNTNDKIWWETKIVTGGRYRVSLKYACHADAVGTKLRVSGSGNTTTGKLRKAHTPNPHQRPTRVRKRRMIQSFITEDLGEITLEPGPTKITLQASDLTGKSVCDVHSLILRRLAP